MPMRAVVAIISLAVLVTTGASRATASQQRGKTNGLCDLVAPAGTGGAGNVAVDEASVVQMYSALQQVSKLPLPKTVKKAVKTLLPLYKKVATGNGDKALSKLTAYVDDECGGAASAKGGKNAGDVDPCEVLTLEDAETLAGTPLNPGTSSPAENATRSCMYTAPTTGPTAQVEFYVGPGAKKALDIDRELKHPITPVADLGSEAYAEPVSVFWQQKGTWYWIRLVRLDAAGQSTAPVEVLAREISDRL